MTLVRRRCLIPSVFAGGLRGGMEGPFRGVVSPAPLLPQGLLEQLSVLLKDFNFFASVVCDLWRRYKFYWVCKKEHTCLTPPSYGACKASAQRTASSKKKKTVAEYLLQGLTTFT